jgi:uncharacterized membrane protein
MSEDTGSSALTVAIVTFILAFILFTFLRLSWTMKTDETGSPTEDLDYTKVLIASLVVAVVFAVATAAFSSKEGPKMQ